MPKKALGKGIRALISEETQLEIENEVRIVAIKDIHPNPYQPREFSGAEIEDLVNSIKENGILQPIVVRKKNSGYELVAGSRRLKAAQIAGLTHVPAVIKNVTESELLAIALVENIQREDLNPIEKAKAYRRLIDEFGMSQEMVAKKVGKDRSTISNALRLLLLPDKVKNYLKNGKISEGHARALLRIGDKKLMEKVCEKIIKEEISVRKLEKMVKEIIEDYKKEEVILKKTVKKDGVIADIEEKISDFLGTKVEIKKGKKKGKIEIEFYSEEHLSEIIEKILKT